MKLPGFAVRAIFGCCVSLVGCASAPPASVEARPGSTPRPDQVHLEGRLVHRVPPAGVQSVDAYLGERFVLEDAGAETVLLPSDTVSAAALLAVVGRRVRVEGTRIAGRRPQAGLAAPLGPDGQAMAQGAGVQVGRLEVVATEP